MSTPGGIGQRPSSARAYRRIAVVVVLVLVARWALSDGAGGGDDDRADPGGDAREVVEAAPVAFALPTPLRASGFAAADGTIFEELSEAQGFSVDHNARRQIDQELPASQVATLTGLDDPSDAELDRWLAGTVSPFIVDMASLTYYATGQAWGDVDRDGDPDLYVTDQDGPNTLLRNDGDGTFSPSPLAEAVALPDDVSGGATFVDVDGDGWLDLHVLNDGPDRLFRNEAGRGFVDITDRAGIDDPGQGETAAWGDFDGDGLLDVYVVDYGCQPCNDAPPVARADRDQHHLYRNEGGGSFRDVTGSIEGIDGTRGLGFSATWFDSDGDDDLDLYVVNDVRNDLADEDVANGIEQGDGSTPGNVLLRNDGPGCGGWCFSDATEASGLTSRSNAMGLCVGDMDGDDDIDLFATNSGFDAGPARLFRNEGGGRFRDVAAELGADLGEWSWGCSVLDFDNDGRRDIYVAVGHSELLMQARMGDLPADPATADLAAIRAGLRDGSLSGTGRTEAPPWQVAPSTAPRTDNDRILHQQPDGTFAEIVLGSVDQLSGITFGSATADVDGDGWVDVVVGNIDSGYRLLRNRAQVGVGNHRVVVRLAAEGPNRDAVGSLVTVVGTDGRRHTQLVSIGGSLGSGHDLDLIFGLGAAGVDRVEVRWPDGRTTVHGDVPTDARAVVTPDGPTEATPLRSR